MKPVSDLSDDLESLTKDNVKPGDKNKIETIKKQIEAVDTTNATQEEKDSLKAVFDRCDSLLKKIADDANSHNTTPATGSESTMALLIPLCFVSGTALAVLCITKKRKKAIDK